MSDERVRLLERKFKETGDPSDEARWEAEALRSGMVPVGYLSGVLNVQRPHDDTLMHTRARVTLDGQNQWVQLEQLLKNDVDSFTYANGYLHFLIRAHEGETPNIISIGPNNELPPYIPIKEHARAPRKIRDLPKTQCAVYRQPAPMNTYELISVNDRPRIVRYAPGAPLRTRLAPKGRLINGTICSFFDNTYLAIRPGDERGYFETTQSKSKRRIPQAGGACYIENDRARFCLPDERLGSGYARPLTFENEHPHEIADASVQTELTTIPIPYDSRIARGELYAPGVRNLSTLYNNGGFPVVRELPRKHLKALLEAVRND